MKRAIIMNMLLFTGIRIIRNAQWFYQLVNLRTGPTITSGSIFHHIMFRFLLANYWEYRLT